MRIIAGDYKGRRLEAPADYEIRPTSDKVKEAMFSIIAPYIEDSVCVDLFSGTGNLGLEALSRGAYKCYFCDNSRTSIGIIKRNISHCRAENTIVLMGDYLKNLEKINEKAHIIFLDPPYEAGLYEKAFNKIRQLGLLDCEGLIVAEHSKGYSMPDELEEFTKVKERKYGHVILSIYGHKDNS